MPREAVLVRTLVELADNLVSDFDIIDVLTTLCERCVDTFNVAAAGVMLAAPDGRLRVVASSSDGMALLELFELQTTEGPCADCHRTGKPIVNPDLSADHRWPHFRARAVADGFRSAHTLPIRLRNHIIGAVNMLRTDTDTLSHEDVDGAQALADVAAIAIAQHHAATDAQALNEQLEHTLAGRIALEQARGRISGATSVDIDQALRVLRNHARNHNLRLTDLSRDVADRTTSVTSLDPLPTPAPR